MQDYQRILAEMAYFIEFVLQGLSVLYANFRQTEKICQFIFSMVLYGTLAWGFMEFYFMGLVLRSVYFHRNKNRQEKDEEVEQGRNAYLQQADNCCRIRYILLLGYGTARKFLCEYKRNGNAVQGKCLCRHCNMEFTAE